MRLGMKSMTLAALLSLISACGQPEHPRTASDFCLNAQRITIEPSPVEGMDDPGNAFDSDQTVNQVLEHNNVVDSLCPQERR